MFCNLVINKKYVNLQKNCDYIDYMKYLFIVLLAAFPIALEAEEKSYDSFLGDEKVWTIKIESLGLNDIYVSYMEYKLMDNVSIDDISYRQLFTRYKGEDEDDWSEWQPGEFGSSTYIGEDSDGKVYYYRPNMENFLLMNFSMQVGDVYQYQSDHYSIPPFVVTAVSDTILENSFDRKPRRCIYLARSYNGEILTEDYHRDVWIEGIGSMKYGMMGMEWFLLSGSRQLMKCTQQGNVIYQCDNMTSVLGIKELASEDVSIYNLAGQKVNASYKGIIVRNGKKVIVK